MPAAREPADLHALFINAFKRQDLDAVVALYEPTATVVTPEGKLAKGPAAIGEMMKHFMAMKPRFTMTITSLAPSGDLVLIRNKWTLDADAGPDGKPVAMTGTAFEVARRQPDGTWLWVIDQPFAA